MKNTTSFDEKHSLSCQFTLQQNVEGQIVTELLFLELPL